MFVRSAFLRRLRARIVVSHVAAMAVALASTLETDKPVCAWCPDFDPKTSRGASHGMCQACSDRMIFEAVKRGQGGAR